MPVDLQQLSDNDAVKAISLVGESWMANRGREVYLAFHGTVARAGDAYNGLPGWARDAPVVTKESGEFARRMLAVLNDAQDEEVRVWTEEALRKVHEPKAHIEPFTLTIGGIILIGAILAARVKKIGSIEFYEGVPENLAKVIKAAAGIAGS
jgi:hypothetical protein